MRKYEISIKYKMRKLNISCSDTKIKELSETQKNIKLKQDNIKDVETRKKLQKERNKILIELHQLVRKQEDKHIEEQIKEIENTKDNSSRMFRAIKQIQKMKPKTPLLIHTKEKETMHGKMEVIRIAARYRK